MKMHLAKSYRIATKAPFAGADFIVASLDGSSLTSGGMDTATRL
jgi:hypothetical protein